ncbi:hypothetical protein A9Q81_06205 [Gammaproteobacteria bacterium 42_54_T18]|nr:hypothetical protein A9Q81_06205 [Gammaproteobacteria bacterium 42_54_T18]
MIDQEEVELESELIEVIASNNIEAGLIRLLKDHRFQHKSLTKNLAKLHNSQNIDVLDFFNSPLISHEDLTNCINQHLDVIALIEAPTKKVLDTILLIQSRVDYCYAPVDKFLNDNEKRIESSVELLIENPTKLLSFLRTILRSYSKIDVEKSYKLANKLIVNPDIKVQIEAIYAIGYLVYAEKDTLLEDGIHLISSLLQNNTDESLLTACLSSLNEICKKDESLRAFSNDCLNLCLQYKSSKVLEEATRIAWLDSKYLTDSWNNCILSYFSKFTIVELSKRSGADHAFTALLKKENNKDALSLLEHLIASNTDIHFTFESWHDVSTAIWANEVVDRDKLITRWFHTGNYNLCKAASDLIIKKGQYTVQVSQIEEKDNYFYIARKAVGWLFVKPKAATYFVLSILDYCEHSDFDKISDLLFYPLLMNTPYSVKEVIEKHIEGLDKRKKKAKFLRAILTKSEKRQEILKQACSNKELHPSTQQREALGRKKYFENEAMMKEVHEKSIFSSIFGKSKVMLYGNKSVFLQHGNNGESKRQVMPLGKTSYSTEIPLFSSIDSIGLNRLINTFRGE